ncbi:hypothetical protein M670_01939 [Schinkia azotoformans MEV2011]|uniref:YqgU-like 6-bladed beta-propeller domain-containing protein n=2 Tax=Schinkia azotoformans TaxID=1454 RepID=A0A072NPA1_SCHAZ|nr:hypothetical protein M670_01939 [Schinkia azotoformans MEV2011]
MDDVLSDANHSWGEEMRKLFVVIICFFLYGCSTPNRVVNDASYIKRTTEEKSIITKQFFSKSSFKPIAMAENEDFYSINEWYDEDTVIYSVGEKEMSSLFLHNLLSGKRNLFYQTNEFITKIQANSAHSLFAVQTLEQSGDSHIRILDKMGKEVFSWDNKIEDLQFMWNPYEPDELVITEFLSYMEFQLLKVNISTKDITEIPVNNPFVQWTSRDELGFLNWDQNEPSLDAPLILFNLKTLKEEEWFKNCIMLFTLKDVVITVSLDNNDLNKSLYTFYESKTRKKLTEVHIPILNTFSEAWWIPSFDFDEDKKIFYYMKPKRAGDISEYNEGYELTALSIDDQKEEVLMKIPNNYPIKLSPDGQQCLIGQQLEQVITISNQQMTNLISN